MHPSIHTWSFRSYKEQNKGADIFKVIDVAAHMGFRGMEIDPAVSAVGWSLEDPSQLKRAKKYAEGKGVAFEAMLAFSFELGNTRDETKRRVDIEHVKHYLRLAGEAGIPCLTMLFGRHLENESKRKQWRAIAEAFRELIPVAEKAGVTMVPENYGGIIYWGRDILSFLDEMGSKNLAVTIDGTNWPDYHLLTGFFEDPTPGDKEVLYQNVQLAAPRARNVHVKVRGVRPDGTLIGYDDDLTRLLTIYRDAGYRGGLVFEMVAEGTDLLTPAAEACAIVDKTLKRIMS
jgi:hypothetical protein